MYISPLITITSLIFLVIGMLVSWRLKSKMREYSLLPNTAGLTGREVAEKMLKDNGINDVKVILTQGVLSDHFDPTSKTVALSEGVYSERSIAAAAVAAHECGHAVQYARAYPWIGLRSKLVPAVQFSSSIVPWVLMIGVLLLKVFPTLLLGGIILFGVTTLFSVITLPVEFDASKRGLAWLEASGVTPVREHEKAKDALWWAAMTYVVAAISSLVILIQYIMIFAGNRRN